MKPLSICLVASTYPRSPSDYAVPWLRESVRRMTMLGHRVTVFAPAYKGLTNHTIDDVEVVRFRYAPGCLETLTHETGAANKIGRLRKRLLGIPYILSGMVSGACLAVRRHFDVVHVHWPFPHEPIGSLIARLCGAPMILHCYGAEFAMARKRWWVRRWLRHSLRQGDMLVAISSDTARQVEEVSDRQAIVVPYGTTVETLPSTSHLNTVPRILFTGRLIQRKGVEYLIRAVAKLAPKRPVEVIITGDGDQREGLEALSRSLGLEKTIQFLGFVANERLAQEYARCDVWVNPSIIDERGDTEGLGVGAIEAYAYGKPVVASNVGGIPDAVRHRLTGLLVPEKDVDALAAAIGELIDNPRLAERLGRQGRDFARQRFDWDDLTEQLESLYYSAISELHPALEPASESKV
jgi:glycosyltransferase involved in cell wall biosynthesis